MSSGVGLMSLVVRVREVVRRWAAAGGRRSLRGSIVQLIAGIEKAGSRRVRTVSIGFARPLRALRTVSIGWHRFY